MFLHICVFYETQSNPFHGALNFITYKSLVLLHNKHIFYVFTFILNIGYDWVGWKKKSNGGTLDLVFTFDQVRTFQKVVIHINNHFTKDIQVFRTAKAYFSNEEDKFADDRYLYSSWKKYHWYQLI